MTRRKVPHVCKYFWHFIFLTSRMVIIICCDPSVVLCEKKEMFVCTFDCLNIPRSAQCRKVWSISAGHLKEAKFVNCCFCCVEVVKEEVFFSKVWNMELLIQLTTFAFCIIILIMQSHFNSTFILLGGRWYCFISHHIDAACIVLSRRSQIFRLIKKIQIAVKSKCQRRHKSERYSDICRDFQSNKSSDLAKLTSRWRWKSK